MHFKKFLLLLFIIFSFANIFAQNLIYLRPDRVFDGEKVFEKYGVIIKGNQIELFDSQANIEKSLPKDIKIVDLKNCTLLPGLIEGHTHLFLHPYNEVPWDDQVLKEARSYRTARAVIHAEKTLKAGFTTARDLGTEGAEFDDVGLKKANDDGVILGPRLLIATKALIPTGSYAHKNF